MVDVLFAESIKGAEMLKIHSGNHSNPVARIFRSRNYRFDLCELKIVKRGCRLHFNEA